MQNQCMQTAETRQEPVTALEMRGQERICSYHSGLKLAGALMSHNSLLLFFRLFVRVLLHGLWQKDTKSAGHWYMVVFLAEGGGNEKHTNCYSSDRLSQKQVLGDK